jgi:ribose 1,5-bisphosphokinase
MSERPASLQATEPLGPGRLVLVVGPSGAGKDTVLTAAKAICAGDPDIIFPRRVVTRPVNREEDHDSLDNWAFDTALQGGAFAFWWEAHGLKYAIPLLVETHIRAGRTVVCNVSRGVVESLRGRYMNVLCVVITAPDDVLAARLAQRGRGSDGSLQARLARNNLYPGFFADTFIDNSGDIEDAVAALLALLRRTKL